MFKPDKTRFILYEALTTILWFMLDASWLFEWLWPANILGVITVFVAILATCYAEQDLGNRAIAVGILAWVTMNAFWVAGDMNQMPLVITIAKICAVGVFICLVTAVTTLHAGQEMLETMKKFRRVRFGDQD